MHSDYTLPSLDVRLVLNALNCLNYLRFRVIQVDDFTRHLWEIYDTVTKEGVAQVSKSCAWRNSAQD